MPAYLKDPGLWNKGGGLFGGPGFSGRPGDIPSMADRYGPGWRKKKKKVPVPRRGGAKLAQEQTIQQYADMLGPSRRPRSMRCWPTVAAAHRAR